MMRICFATYQAVMMLKGGPRTQMLQSKLELEKLGVRVTLFDSWKELKRGDVDLVHLFGANIGTYHLAREIHRLGIPTVVSPIFYTRHSAASVRRVATAGRILKGFARGIWTDYGMMADMCLWADRVAPNTVDEGSLFIEGMGVQERNIYVVPNGVEARFEKGNKALFKKKFGTENFILNVGHIGPDRKNVLRLIQALETINHPAVIIGRIEKTPEGDRCLELARRNPRLMILDSMAHDSGLFASAYAACDVFVLPSLFETPGIAALEAGLAGAKVVITPHGGTKEYFREYAEYVDPYSVENIRKGIQNSLNRQKNTQLRDHIKKNFLWKSVAQRLVALYQTVLEKIPE